MNWTLVSAVVLVATVATAKEEPIQECFNKCKEQKDGSESAIKACQEGCSMYSNKESDRSFFGTGFFRDSNDVIIKCNNDCQLSYQDPAESGACSDGCSLMRDSSPGANDDTVFDFGNGGIRISFGRLPEMPKMSDLLGHVNQMVNDQHARIQRLFSNDEEQAEEKMIAEPFEPFVINNKPLEIGNEEGGTFGGIFQAMQNQMQNMVQNIFKNGDGNDIISEQRDENGKLIHGGGELVVIKSGPGYRSTKKYHLGPDADIEKILMNTDMNDMMNHKNPIEQFLQHDQVEVFDPEKAKAEADEKNRNDNAAIRPASSIFDTDPWGLIKKQLGLSKDDIDNSMELEEPRLPETGLRSRHLKIEDSRSGNSDNLHEVFRFDTVDVCMMDRAKQSWSEWANCLHVRLGVPNWFLVITVAMGVIFTLWLCLVIPSNAPKQRIAIRQPKNIDTKELEANAMASVIMTSSQVNMDQKVDLPPSYEDIVSTKVPPPPQNEKEVEALKSNNLETKIVLCDEELEIVEPLPQKVNLDNEDRNCSNV